MRCNCKAASISNVARARVKAHLAAQIEKVEGVCRRSFIEFAAGGTLGVLGAGPAEAKVPKGYQAVRDTGDGYEFVFPFGWQEVSVNGIDVVYKDVIEPLESVAVQLTATEKESILDYGPVNEVAGTLANSVLARASDEVQLITTEAENADGRHGSLSLCLYLYRAASMTLLMLHRCYG
jgi:PsbP